MFVELYAMKCFALGSFITGYGVWKYFKYKYEVKHFDIDIIRKLKKP